MRPLEESEKKKKTFKASHFENIQELLDACRMWIRDDDYDAYCRFFDMGAMEELLNELEKKDKIINAMTEWIENEQHNKIDDDNFYTPSTFMLTKEEIKQYFEREVKDD